MLEPGRSSGSSSSKTLPLAAFAGLRLRSLDDRPARSPSPAAGAPRTLSGSTYFAAQAMAAEMSTGAPAMVLVAGSAAPRWP